MALALTTGLASAPAAIAEPTEVSEASIFDPGTPPSKPAFGARELDEEPEVAGLIVQYKPGTPVTEKPGIATGSSVIPNFDLEPGRAIGFGLRTVDFPEPVSESAAERLAAQLQRSPSIVLAEPDYVLKATELKPSSQDQQEIQPGDHDPKSPEQSGSPQAQAPGSFETSEIGSNVVQSGATWGLDRIDQRSLPVNGRYEYNNNGAGVDVYVVDTGIRAAHVDFSGRVSSGYTSISDGRGTDDCDGHGTHVAGTIGGSTYGVAKGVNLIPVRVLDCSGSGATSGVIAGLNWIVTHHTTRPAVVNMSLGGPISSSLDSAVRSVISDRVTVVVAAGNEGRSSCNYSPARVLEAITVNASTSSDRNAWFSNYGSCSDIYAPGQSITSAWYTSNTATATIDGTSMAAPHVAGVAARWLGLNPGWSQSQVWNQINADHTYFGASSYLPGDPTKLLFVAPGSSPGTPPAAPVISGVTPGNGQLSVAFSSGFDGGSPITNYQFSVNGGSTWTTRTPASTSTPLVITGLTNGASYSLRIRAVNAIGAGAQSNLVTATPTAPVTVPAAPTSVVATPGNGALVVTWTAPASDGGSSITQTAANAYLASTGAFVRQCAVTSGTSCTITGLANGTAYRIQVFAQNTRGWSPPSTPITATPIATDFS